MWRRNPNIHGQQTEDLLLFLKRTDSHKLKHFREIIRQAPDIDLRPGSLAWHIATYVDSKRWYLICA